MARDDRIRALEFDSPEYIPVRVGLLPATWMTHREKLEDIVLRHPVLFGPYEKGSRDFDQVGGTYAAGRHTDAWGCVWENIHAGCEAYVTYHPVPRREDVRTLKAPTERSGLPHGFMYMRLFYLRGFEELMVDFAEEPPELQMLIDIVLDYNMRQLELELKEGVPPIKYFGDDLGMQDRLPISPSRWRKYLKPCFARILGRCREAGAYTYLHSDGHYYEIIPDLKDCGLNVVNPQIRANGLDNLARVCRGKICVDLDLDRQMFPFCTPRDIDRHVREAVEALGLPEGGLWLSAECGPDVPLENIEAICVALEKYRAYFR
jgi:hypothetical protein